MRYVSLGHTGLKVSQLCLGARDFGSRADSQSAKLLMDHALELGINFLDVADCYPIPLKAETWGRAEEIVGQWIARRRTQVVIATKFGSRVGAGPNDKGNSRKHITEACEASLRRLRTDYIDVYYAHHPDPETPIEETLEALELLLRAGKILYWGVSNFSAWQVAAALLHAPRNLHVSLCASQVRYNLLHREPEREIFPLCQEVGIAALAYNPLATGMLGGRYVRGQGPPRGSRFGGGKDGRRYRDFYWSSEMFDAVERVRVLAQAEGWSMAQLSLAWLLRQKAISAAVIGASTTSQLDEAVEAVDLSPSRRTLAALQDVTTRFI